MKRNVLVIGMICIISILGLFITGCEKKGDAKLQKYAEQITDVNCNNEKIIVISNNGNEHSITPGYVLLEVKNKKIQNIISEVGVYKDVKNDCQYYYLDVKEMLFSGKSSVSYKNETYNYNLNFSTKINGIENLFSKNEVSELTCKEFFDKYVKNILENNVNKILVEKAEKNGKSIKEIDSSDLSQGLKEVLEKENIGYEIPFINISFE